ncbi:MAG: minichromosome maintenance protein MCM [Candidatus Lokiarchaeota archaeon]|nr:minichromosome maintenance protein MCM [Candidatus Lokiarchaeota archaeon]
MVMPDDMGLTAPQDPVAKFEDFLRLFEDPVGTFVYLNKAKYIIADSEKTRTMTVDFTHLMRHDPQLAKDLHENPTEYLKKANQAAVNILHDQSNGAIKLTDEYFVRFTNVPSSYCIKLRKIRSDHMERLFAVSGSLIRATNVRPEIKMASFECKACGAMHEIQQLDDDLSYPVVCNIGGCKNAKKTEFRLVGRTSKFIDWQQIRIQEMPEELSAGNVPRYLDALLLHDLVDTFRPGDRVTLVGAIKIAPIKKLNAGQGRVFQQMMHVNSIYSEEETHSEEITEDDEEKIKTLAKDPFIHTKIIRSISPGLYGMEMEKLATALSLFGGVHKVRGAGHNIRGDIHVLIMGDPGTGKSQLIKAASKLAPRAIYTSGQGSTAAGLTAAVLRDETTGNMVLEAGALVLADNGVAAIDEFDKMKIADRVAIHEAMEQQSISISKAGIVANLNCRTTIIAAANPKMGRYDDNLTISENINLQPTILSRFDLIFIVRDKPDEKNDGLIADHILKLHMPQDKLAPGEEIIESPIEAGFLKKYIRYARAECEPQMTAEASAKIKEFYIKLRKPAQGDKEMPIPIVARTLEGLIRLSEAHAKMALRKEVLVQDVEAVIKVQEESMKQVSWDAERQQFDVDGLQLGKSHSKRERLTKLYTMIKNLQEEGHDEPVDMNSIVERAGFAPLNLKEDEVKSLVEQLKKEAMIVEKKNGKFLVVKDTK